MNDELKKIEIPQVISVGEFAELLGKGPAAVVGELMKNGVMATVNEQIDFDTAQIIGNELGFDIIPKAKEDEVRPNVVNDSEQILRPPVVAVMGHVDHGKTSLLDAIRSAEVALGEAGGITQHIGAYQVTKNDRVITFLDTPGHEAFSALREHGAKIADIAIIVVAADDGVKPQTREAIDHAREAGAALVVAINKIDKEGADTNRVKQELSEINVIPDDWGGDTPCVEVSAKTGDGIPKLLEVVLLVADIVETKARIEGHGRGVVIESHLDTGMGPIVTLLIQEGTIGQGDWIIAGSSFGKIRTMVDFTGKKLKQATPAMPAVVSGLKSLPDFGNWFEQVKSEKEAKDWVDRQSRKKTYKSVTSIKSVTAEDIANAVTEGEVKGLPVVVKADVQGSLESLISAIEQVGNDEVRAKIVSSGVGDISEKDVQAATASGAIILGFNVSINAQVNQQAKREGVDFQLYKVIYELLDDVRDWLSSMLEPETIETEHAKLKILGVFKTTKDKVVCGGKVISGKITPDLQIKIIHSGKEIGTGKLLSLQKDKQSSKEAMQNEECGLEVSTNKNIEMGDELVFYTTSKLARKL
ncbi:MAG: translation initiation factor IF-2 [Patescibacteria group bacterium]|nr:translation initiation factor IF-2 [Patescibacteria group bacterium]